MGVFETTQPFNMILHMNCKNGIITTCIIAFISTDRFNVSHKSPLFIMSNPPPPFFFTYTLDQCHFFMRSPDLHDS